MVPFIAVQHGLLGLRRNASHRVLGARRVVDLPLGGLVHPLEVHSTSDPAVILGGYHHPARLSCKRAGGDWLNDAKPHILV